MTALDVCTVGLAMAHRCAAPSAATLAYLATHRLQNRRLHISCASSTAQACFSTIFKIGVLLLVIALVLVVFALFGLDLFCGACCRQRRECIENGPSEREPSLACCWRVP